MIPNLEFIPNQTIPSVKGYNKDFQIYKISNLYFPHILCQEAFQNMLHQK